MTQVQLQSVRKVYAGGVTALQDVSLTIEAGQRFVLAGPSGCGKTTLLRVIAGLERPDGGRVLFDGRDMAAVEPKDRRVGMVFQNALLYPHLSVFENLAFAMRIEGRKSKGEIQSAVSQTAETLGIGELLGRMPGQLSGGQAQRVAIGKALLRDPAVLLLDEPMSHLDGLLKEQLQDLILTVQKLHRLTILYVTHDQAEALSIADRVCVMDRGSIQQVGTPQEVFCRPANRFVDDFFRRMKVRWANAEKTDIQEKGRP
jgi:multiple sugar transport system ATP-binding protein